MSELVIDPSKLKDLSSCKRFFHLKHAVGLKREFHYNNNLNFGTSIHKGIEVALKTWNCEERKNLEDLEYVFTFLMEQGFSYVDVVQELKKDNSFINKVLNAFENEYLEVLYSETSEVLHERLNSAAARIASYWYSCWVKAGSPPPPK